MFVVPCDTFEPLPNKLRVARAAVVIYEEGGGTND